MLSTRASDAAGWCRTRAPHGGASRSQRNPSRFGTTGYVREPDEAARIPLHRAGWISAYPRALPSTHPEACLPTATHPTTTRCLQRRRLAHPADPVWQGFRLAPSRNRDPLVLVGLRRSLSSATGASPPSSALRGDGPLYAEEFGSSG